MKTIPRTQAEVLELNQNSEPLLYVQPGETFCVETNDHMHQLILDRLLQSGKRHIRYTREEFPPILVTPMQANPVAGPIYVEGAEPGDLLAVHIEDIIPGDHGSTIISEGSGVLADRVGWEEVQGFQAWLFDLLPGPSGTTSDGTAMFEDDNGRRWTWKLAPHIGTICTCPSKGRGIPETLTTQGAWGGNVDVHDVCKGHTVYLNCFNPGGLLYLGDVHAAQGDSELTGAAIETYASVVITVEVIKNKRIPGVMRIETPHSIIQIDSNMHAGSHKDALNACYLGLMRWMIEDYGFSQAAAYVHMTANPNVRAHVYQFIDGFFTCGVEIEKESLA